MKDSFTQLKYNATKENWIDLDGTNQIFLRVIYGNYRPITDINFYRIKCYKGDPNRIVSLKIYSHSKQNPFSNLLILIII